MRKGAVFLAMCVAANLALAQPAAPLADLLDVTIGKPYPVPPLFAVESRPNPFPVDYTVFAPMPATSKLNLFQGYEADIMEDTGNVYRLRAKRAYESTDACARALKVVGSVVASAYHLTPTRSELSVFQASSPETEMDATCAYDAGSPYPVLSLDVKNKAESARAIDETRKAVQRMRKQPTK
jgi:hypothetical protein